MESEKLLVAIEQGESIVSSVTPTDRLHSTKWVVNTKLILVYMQTK